MTNKANFIYQWSEGHGYNRNGNLSDITLVESLLSDRRTLFSDKYLDYLYNHENMLQQNRIVSQNGLDTLCVNFALDATPNLPAEWEPIFKDTLEHLMQQAHCEKKPLMTYYNMLYDFYCQTDDAEKLIALNSLVQCNQPDFETGLDPDDIITYLLDVSGQCRKWEEDNEKPFPEFVSEEMYRDFVSAAMLGCVSPKREILNDVSDQLLKRMQRERKPAAMYDRFLLDAYKKAKGKISSAVLDKIKEWYPDTKIPVNAAIYFLCKILNKCVNKERDIKGMKKLLGSGNFSPTYTAQDAQEAQAYIDRKRQFKSLRENFMSWKESHKFPFRGEEDAGEEFGEKIGTRGVISISDKQLNSVRIHLTNYVVNIRSRVKELSNDVIQGIIIQVYNEFENLAPFRLMVLCTIGSGEFPIGRRSLTKNFFEDFLKKIQSQSSAKNRYHRFLLLVRLCESFNFSAQDIETNLLYFMKYHGIVIGSDEEFKCWYEVLQKNKLLDSPASLGFKYYFNLKECFPLHLESLFCYESYSALHIDGFYSLTKAFPDLVEHYRHNVTVPKDICQKFIRAWPNEKRSQDLKDGKAGRDAIKKICHKSIKRLKWDELDKAKDKIREWDHDRKRKPFTPTAAIDMEELRALFTEIAISGTIARASSKYLSQQIQSYYSSLNVLGQEENQLKK